MEEGLIIKGVYDSSIEMDVGGAWKHKNRSEGGGGAWERVRCLMATKFHRKKD
ncbi:hypothetical protein COLO4_00265 [Corchorus olitorius]|uniref:Uncharacterized protein n=1 Tax=Corchorus olitorius TaxID=93759 RepID=A0A1R3L471_9ROSI|nr:hypothetical protein COLO4_00265 [Corchorus olitorius]